MCVRGSSLEKEGEGVDQKELRFDGGDGSSSRDFTPGKTREESRPRETAISILG